jgi:hypothetical protein
VVRERYAPVHKRKHPIFERYAPERDTYGARRERSDRVPER